MCVVSDAHWDTSMGRVSSLSQIVLALPGTVIGISSQWYPLLFSTYNLMNHYFHFLSVDTTIIVSSKCLKTVSVDKEW